MKLSTNTKIQSISTLFLTLFLVLTGCGKSKEDEINSTVQNAMQGCQLDNSISIPNGTSGNLLTFTNVVTDPMIQELKLSAANPGSSPIQLSLFLIKQYGRTTDMYGASFYRQTPGASVGFADDYRGNMKFENYFEASGENAGVVTTTYHDENNSGNLTQLKLLVDGNKLLGVSLTYPGAYPSTGAQTVCVKSMQFTR